MTIPQRKWWKDAVIYQIYPASFKDSNGDGIGDLRGIISELDYIKSIGVEVIWICPMYDSPQYDMGYDISDYEKVYPPYGTMDDMETLIQETHGRGMRIILDLVINHTSHLHAWFKESRSSKQNPKRDWYIWRPAKYVNGERKPPNNWRGNFGGSVWEWDEHTQEYYLHLFAPEQPDLNWENETTRKAIYESAMEFWLQKGVDGFRVDTVNMYSKAPEYADAPITDAGSDWQMASDYYCNGPRMHEFLGEMNQILGRYDAMTVGECPNTPDQAKVLRYVSAKENQLNMVFQFDVVDLGMGSIFKYQTIPRNFTLMDLKRAVTGPQNLIKGTDAWTTVFMENHDQARSISRFASDDPQYRVRSGKMLALMLACLSGTLYIYQGQEIGAVNVSEDWSIEEYKDLDSQNYYTEVARRTNNDPEALIAAKKAIHYLARDNARVPMQWDDTKNGGFSTGKPWMRVHDLYRDINVRAAQKDKHSVLAFWKLVLQLRRQHNDLLVHGDFGVFDMENPHTFTFTKTYGDKQALVCLNFTKEEQTVMPVTGARMMLKSSYEDTDFESDRVLRPFEGRVYLLS